MSPSLNPVYVAARAAEDAALQAYRAHGGGEHPECAECVRLREAYRVANLAFSKECRR